MPMLPTDHPWAFEVQTIVPLVRDAAATVRGIYESGQAATHTKGDGSPVTDADLAADRMLREGIQRTFPADAVLTEESADNPTRVANPRCWIADPIDGTAQFVARTGLFDILLALVEEHQPVVSICAHPPTGVMTLAVRNRGAWWIDERGEVSPFRVAQPGTPPRLVTSRYYGPRDFSEAIEHLATSLATEPLPVLDFGYGPRAFLPRWRTYDAFVGFWKPDGDSPVREWDLAASDLLTTEAGGMFTDMYGNRYRYNQPSPRPRAGVLASASAELHERILDAVAPFLPAAPPPVPATSSTPTAPRSPRARWRPPGRG